MQPRQPASDQLRLVAKRRIVDQSGERLTVALEVARPHGRDRPEVARRAGRRRRRIRRARAARRRLERGVVQSLGERAADLAPAASAQAGGRGRRRPRMGEAGRGLRPKKSATGSAISPTICHQKMLCATEGARPALENAIHAVVDGPAARRLRRPPGRVVSDPRARRGVACFSLRATSTMNKAARTP